jgi:hypothetical protein
MQVVSGAAPGGDREGEIAMPEHGLIPAGRIERLILVLRGQRAMLDADLAALYGVEAKALNRAVKRNNDRFPADFVFQLTEEEAEILRCHFGTSRSDDPGLRPKRSNPGSWGGRRYLPYAFTEQGVAMLSSVLRSPRAAQANVEIMRTFVRLRRMLQANAELARKLEELEKKYDAQFRIVFDAIRELMAPPSNQKRRIGFGEE